VEVYLLFRKHQTLRNVLTFYRGFACGPHLGKNLLHPALVPPYFFSKFTHMCAAYIKYARQFDKMMVIHDDTYA